MSGSEVTDNNTKNSSNNKRKQQIEMMFLGTSVCLDCGWDESNVCWMPDILVLSLSNDCVARGCILHPP